MLQETKEANQLCFGWLVSYLCCWISFPLSWLHNVTLILHFGLFFIGYHWVKKSNEKRLYYVFINFVTHNRSMLKISCGSTCLMLCSMLPSKFAIAKSSPMQWVCTGMKTCHMGVDWYEGQSPGSTAFMPWALELLRSSSEGFALHIISTSKTGFFILKGKALLRRWCFLSSQNCICLTQGWCHNLNKVFMLFLILYF